MIDPDDYFCAVEDMGMALFMIRDYDPTNLDDVRHILRGLTDVIDNLKDLQDELIQAEGLLDPEGRYDG